MSRHLPASLPIALTLCLCGCSGKSDFAVTSCAQNLGFGGDTLDPSFLRILGQTVALEPGSVSGPIRACYYRDLERPEEGRKIVWEVANTAVAVVDPTTGPETRITARSLGETTLRATLGTASASRPVTVQRF